MKVNIQVCEKCYYWPINGEEHKSACKQCGNVNSSMLYGSARAGGSNIHALYDLIKSTPPPMPTTPLAIPYAEMKPILRGM